MSDLTPEEKRWIASVRRVMTKRPPTLGLFSMDSDLKVVALDERGNITHGNVGGQRGPAVVFVDTANLDVPCDSGLPNAVSLDEIDRPWVDAASPGAVS